MDRDWLAFSRSSFRSKSVDKLFWLATLPLLLALAGCMGGGSKVEAASSSGAAETIAITISSPGDGSTMQSPLAVSAQATGTSAITHMQVLLDSVRVAEASSANIQASVVAAAGSHQLTVTATDANGSNARKSVGFAVPRSSLSISWPPDGATLPSPVHVSANSSDTQPGTTLQLLVDGKPQSVTAGSALQADVPLSVGSHRIRVSSSDSTGDNQQQEVSVSVPAPRAARAYLFGHPCYLHHRLDRGPGLDTTRPIAFSLQGGAAMTTPPKAHGSAVGRLSASVPRQSRGLSGGVDRNLLRGTARADDIEPMTRRDRPHIVRVSR